MPIAYRSPGVYKEEIFLQPEARLPTGVPALVGFADAIAVLENFSVRIQFPASLQNKIQYDSDKQLLIFQGVMSSQEKKALLEQSNAIAVLENLPSGIQFPASLQNKIQYDSDKQLLIFQGVMSLSDKQSLLAVSTESIFQKAIDSLVRFKTTFQKAIESLFNSAQKVVLLNRQQEFAAQFLTPRDSYLTQAVFGFFENGGTRCYVVRAEPITDRESSLKEALTAIAPLNDLDLVAIPDAMLLRLPNQQPEKEAIIRVQQAVLEHCTQQGDRLAILDSFPTLIEGKPQLTLEEVTAQRNQLIVNQKEPLNGTLYYPWIKNTQGNLVPPCGHVAGIFARSDRTRGVYKAPANEEIRDALDLEVRIDNTIQDQLNPEGINCLRAFPVRGIRVWGTRTLSRDPNWRYVNVRRLFLTFGRWIERKMLWASFEPNSPQLWVRIQRELNTYLERLWQVGALQGQTPAQAFYVKCDAETNPPESRETGSVITEIGLAAVFPAEFLVVRIIHRFGTVEVTE